MLSCNSLRHQQVSLSSFLFSSVTSRVFFLPNYFEDKCPYVFLFTQWLAHVLSPFFTNVYFSFSFHHPILSWTLIFLLISPSKLIFLLNTLRCLATLSSGTKLSHQILLHCSCYTGYSLLVHSFLHPYMYVVMCASLKHMSTTAISIHLEKSTIICPVFFSPDWTCPSPLYHHYFFPQNVHYNLLLWTLIFSYVCSGQLQLSPRTQSLSLVTFHLWSIWTDNIFIRMTSLIFTHITLSGTLLSSNAIFICFSYSTISKQFLLPSTSW